MQRSPVIFWLLLAATLAVDLVAVFWAYAATLDRTEALYFGLACSQLSLICIWTSFSSARRFWRWLAPFAFTLAVVVLTILLYERGQAWLREPAIAFDMAMAYLGLWIAQIMLLLVGLWLLRERWQFSVMHLLAVMTVGGIAIVILREADIIQEIWIPFALWLANNVLLAMLAVVIHKTAWKPVLRLAAVVSVAVAFGLIITMFFGLGQSNATAINIIQAIVLFVWLEFGGLIPERLALSEVPADSLAEP